MEPIREYCRRLHLRCERNNTGKVKSQHGGWMMLHSEGTWDLEVYIPDAGCSAMVECKMPGEGLTPAQAEWGKIYRDCGKELIVATSVHEFAAELEYIRRRRDRERVDELDAIKRGESRVPQSEAMRTLQGVGPDPGARPVAP
jgi:hypothetical protein